MRLRARSALIVAAVITATLASAEARAEPPKDEAKSAPRAGTYTLEAIDVRGNTKTASHIVLGYVRLRPGRTLDVSDPEITLTRYRLLGTGFFASVELSLRRGTERGSVRLVIDVVERNTIVVQNLWLGVAADQDTAGKSKPLSAFVGLKVAETNLAGRGITLGAGVGLAAGQVSVRAELFDPHFFRSSFSFSSALLFTSARDFFGSRDVIVESTIPEQKDATTALVAYRRIGGMLGVGHPLSITSQLGLELRVEHIDATLPLLASHLRGGKREPIHFDILPGKSWLSSVRAYLVYDSRDLPFLTQRGTLASASVMGGVPPFGSSYGFVRVELGAARWWRLPFGHVVRASAFLGGVFGSAPFFEKFYVGDLTDLLPDRVLDLAPDRRRPPNILGTDIVEVRYGDYAARADVEYRIPIYTGRTAIFGVDMFVSTGLYAVATRREISDPPAGYTGAARIPVDLTYNVGIRLDTSLGGATIAFSNLLGLVPVRSSTP